MQARASAAPDMNGASRRLRSSPRIAKVWQGLIRKLFEGYHPERHYMRGPGPAWHAKNG